MMVALKEEGIAALGQGVTFGMLLARHGFVSRRRHSGSQGQMSHDEQRSGTQGPFTVILAGCYGCINSGCRKCEDMMTKKFCW